MNFLMNINTYQLCGNRDSELPVSVFNAICKLNNILA